MTTKQPTDPKQSTTVHTRLSPDNLAKIKRIAELSGRTVSNVINRIIESVEEKPY